jgi:hypothetical protein
MAWYDGGRLRGSGTLQFSTGYYMRQVLYLQSYQRYGRLGLFPVPSQAP